MQLLIQYSRKTVQTQSIEVSTMNHSNNIVPLEMTLYPGCQAVLPVQNLPTNPRYHASSECWASFGELSAYNIEHAEPTFLHQLAVDAYGAQHAGGQSRPITTTFSLIGMYLVHEKGFTGRQVQLAHMQLAKHKFSWITFDPPNQTGTLTVVDVLQAEAGAARDQQIREWSASVWESWLAFHGWTAEFCQKHL